MIICIIENINNHNFEGVIGYTKDDIGYLSNNNELNNYLDIITDYDYLTLDIEEHLNDKMIILNKKVSLKDDLYLYGLMEYLPLPYRIKKYKEVSGSLIENLKNSFIRSDI